MASNEDVGARFCELADKDRIDIARWTLQELRYLNADHTPIDQCGLFQYAQILGVIPLAQRRTFAKKFVAGAMELSQSEVTELAERFRRLLPLLSQGKGDGSMLAKNALKVLEAARKQKVPEGERQALVATLQEEVLVQFHENPLPLSAAFTDLSDRERAQLVDDLIAAGFVPADRRVEVVKMLHPGTHGLLAFIVMLYTFRWAIVIMPVSELLFWALLPRTIACGWIGTCSGEPCTILHWLFIDSAVTMAILVVLHVTAQKCAILFEQLRTNSVVMTKRLKAAYKQEDAKEQAKELGVSEEFLQEAKIGFVISSVALVVGALLTMWGVLEVVLNIASCRLLTFIIASLSVASKVGLVIGVGLMLVHSISTMSSPDALGDENGLYGSLA